VSAMKQSAESGDEFDLLIIGGGSVGTGTWLQCSCSALKLRTVSL
jgi:glycerol-3-phosphate dehydrogenase